MRGDQLTRQWHILRRIEASRTGLTAGEIAGDTGASLRTVYRDLESLQDAGFPLYTEKTDTGNRWRFVEGWSIGGTLPLDANEMVALHLSRELLGAVRGTDLFASLDTLLGKIRAALPSETLAFAERLQAAFHAGTTGQKDYGRLKGIVNQVAAAVMDNRRLEMVYRPLHSGAETRRKVDPYSLWFNDGTLYLVGHCHLRGQVRTFVLDRIRMLHPSEERFDRPADFDLKEYVRDSFGVMRDELQEVRVRISPGWSRYIGERAWHPSQQIEKKPDGSLELTFRVAGMDEIKRWVLGLGPEAEVLAPENLRETIRQDLDRMVAYYEPPVAVAPRLGQMVERIKVD